MRTLNATLDPAGRDLLASLEGPLAIERQQPEARAIAASGPLTFDYVADDGVVCPVADWAAIAPERAPTVLFLPGLLGRNAHWDSVARELSKHARCVCFGIPYTELRGSRCSVDGITSMAASFTRRHLNGAAAVVGSSIGGHTAVRMALDHPELVSAMVLMGSSGLKEERGASEFRLAPSREWLAERFGVMFHRPEVHVSQHELDRLHRMFANRESTRSFIRLARSTRGDHLSASLDRVRVPTLVLWGSDDVVTPRSAALQFASGIRGAELCWIEECGHAPMVEQPAAVARGIGAFLGRIRSSLDTMDPAVGLR